MSGNRNMAEYTNFQGRTNKRIVQAPGGASSFSLAWSNEPTDYGPDRHYRRQSREKNNDFQNKPQEKINYSQPMRVMEQPPKSYGSRNMGPINQQQDNRLGGQYGYGNGYNSPQLNQPMVNSYGNSEPKQGYGNYGNYRNNHVDQLELAVQEQKIFKNHRPPSVPRQQNPAMQGKPSIRINGPPKQNVIFGNDYDYWKDSSNKTDYQKKQNPSQKRLNSQQYEGYSQKSLGSVEKTSIKVHNPPGGKQSFTLG